MIVPKLLIWCPKQFRGRRRTKYAVGDDLVKIISMVIGVQSSLEEEDDNEESSSNG